MARGRPVKEFHEYIQTGIKSKITSQKNYVESPATAFLKNVVEAKSSIELCVRQLPKKNDGAYTQKSYDTLQYLSLAVLPTIMGHFETFERYLFAGIFDQSVFLKDFDVGQFEKQINKQGNVAFDIVRLSAYRKVGAESIGILLADSLFGWHNPARVNSLFNAFQLNYELFSSDDCLKLDTLWQLRHSIVHTGCTLALPDAQKVKQLENLGGKQLSFENNFIFEVARKLHPIVKKTTEGIGQKFKNKLIDNISKNDRNKIDKLFNVKSSISVWLK